MLVTYKGTKVIKLKPCGTTDSEGYYAGKPWDEMGNKGISQIWVRHGEEIHSLQFAYLDGTSVKLSNKHGSDLNSYNLITLDYPSEYLISVAGTYSGDSVNSLTFGTNRGIYGPFGLDFGTNFCLQMGKDFFGFHGYSNDEFLTAIGVYLNPAAKFTN